MRDIRQYLQYPQYTTSDGDVPPTGICRDLSYSSRDVKGWGIDAILILAADFTRLSEIITYAGSITNTNTNTKFYFKVNFDIASTKFYEYRMALTLNIFFPVSARFFLSSSSSLSILVSNRFRFLAILSDTAGIPPSPSGPAQSPHPAFTATPHSTFHIHIYTRIRKKEKKWKSLQH